MTTRAYSACEGTYTSGEAHTFCILLLGVDSTPLRFKHWHMLDLPTYRCTPRKFGPVANSQGKCLQSTCEWFCRLCGRAALQCKIHSMTQTPSTNATAVNSTDQSSLGCTSMGVDIFFSMIFSYFLGTASQEQRVQFPRKSRSLIWPVKHDQRSSKIISSSDIHSGPVSSFIHLW